MYKTPVLDKEFEQINIDESTEDEPIDNKEVPTKIKDREHYPLPPMDYSEMVAAVFERGANGRFAYWAPYAKYVHRIQI